MSATKVFLCVVALSLVAVTFAHNCDKVCNPDDFPHPPLYPLDGSDWATFSLSALALILAAGGGIGGGGMLVPIYILVGNFTPKEAVPLSNITILGGSIANTFFNFLKKHPFETDPPPGRKPVLRPRIDFDIVNVMEPMTIAGAVLGSLINKVLPGWLLTIMLMVILAAITIKTVISGRAKWNKENKDRERKANCIATFKSEHEVEPTAEELDDLLVKQLKLEAEEARQKKAEEEHLKAASATEMTSLNGESKTTYSSDMQDSKVFTTVDERLQWEQHCKDRIAYYEADEAQSFPCFKLCLLAFVWAGVNVLDLFRGGGSYKGPFDINCGDTGYWVFTFLYIPFTVAVASYVACYLMKETVEKDEIGYPWIEGDVRWNLKRSIVFPLICSTAGIFAGMFGVGGGIVKGPLMNEMGVLPEVTSATAAFMIFFTASAATVSYALYGMILWPYAYVLLVLGFVITAFGQYAVFYVVEKLGRPSLIVFVIAGILGASAIMLAVNGISSVIAQLDCGCTVKYDVCGH